MNADEIIHLAESLALDHPGIGGGGDPAVGFNDYEIDMVEADFEDDFEGLIRYKNGEFHVFVNTGHENSRTIGRRRFTAAHEFAHFNIPEHRDAIRSGTGVHKSISGFESKEPMEREADIFASHFLIPTNKLIKRCGNRTWGAREILDTSQHFQTSVTCAALRCQASLPGNSTLIMWGPEKVRWQQMNKDWWFELPARSIRTIDNLAKGSATERLLDGEIATDQGFLRRGTTRASWFPRVATWSRDNNLLIEEAIPLGSYGVLTLLRPDTFI